MTPEERELVRDLFERLAKLENMPRDPEAEQLIRSGLAKAPNALYSLVQSVLVQDEALKRADARIRELGGEAADDVHPRSFLDTMREALFGPSRDDRRGSVPTVRPGEQPMGAPPQYRTGYAGPMGGPGAAPYPQESYRPGGSFLGTAAAAAAGAIGGGLLLGGIRNMLGGGNQGPFAGTFNQIADPGSSGASPWGGGLAGGDLSKQAGFDDIGGGRQAFGDPGNAQGMFDTAGGSDDDIGGFDGGSDSA